MEKELRKQYEACYKELQACPADDAKQLFYISGKQKALETLAANCGITLVLKNIHTLAGRAGLKQAQ